MNEFAVAAADEERNAVFDNPSFVIKALDELHGVTFLPFDRALHTV